jgi:hypothetical protein
MRTFFLAEQRNEADDFLDSLKNFTIFSKEIDFPPPPFPPPL